MKRTDAHYMADGFNNDTQAAFFAVYDGHGGKDAAVFCSQNLHQVYINVFILYFSSRLIWKGPSRGTEQRWR